MSNQPLLGVACPAFIFILMRPELIYVLGFPTDSVLDAYGRSSELYLSSERLASDFPERFRIGPGG